MNRRLAELYSQQGRLLERSAAQRASLIRQLAPLQRVLQRADTTLATLRSGALYVLQYPLVLAAAVLGLVLLKPRRAWRWGVRGLWLWRTWGNLHRWLPWLGR